MIIELRPETMSQGNKYEARVPGVPEKEGTSLGTAAWLSTPENPLPPSQPPVLQANSTHLLWFLCFLSTADVCPQPYTPQTQQPALRLESRRRIGGKIIKILQLWARRRVWVNGGLPAGREHTHL